MGKQDNVWSVDIPIEPGCYTFKFIVDGNGLQGLETNWRRMWKEMLAQFSLSRRKMRIFRKQRSLKLEILMTNRRLRTWIFRLLILMEKLKIPRSLELKLTVQRLSLRMKKCRLWNPQLRMKRNRKN